MHVYFSKNNDALNGMPFQPELINGCVMVNPHYPVSVIPGTKITMDSGAFQKEDMLQRLSPRQALDRQRAFANQIIYDEWRFRHFPGYDLSDPGNLIEGVITYDMLCGVDEVIIDGKRVKQRGTEETAKPAIAATLQSALHYHQRRDEIAAFSRHIAFAAQGATPRQYVNECVLPLLDLMRPDDWFAFGGFCIIGMQPRLKPLFVQTVRTVLPLLVKAGIKRAHILGVFVADMVDFATKEARTHGIVMSNDSSSAETNSILGKVFDGTRYQLTGEYGENKYDTPWQKVYTKEQKYGAYHPCQLAIENIQRYHDWSTTL